MCGVANVKVNIELLWRGRVETKPVTYSLANPGHAALNLGPITLNRLLENTS